MNNYAGLDPYLNDRSAPTVLLAAIQLVNHPGCGWEGADLPSGKVLSKRQSPPNARGDS
jgi:hypothetical protein